MTPVGQKQSHPRGPTQRRAMHGGSREGDMAAQAARFGGPDGLSGRVDSRSTSRHPYGSFPREGAGCSRERRDIWAALSEDHRAGLELEAEIEKQRLEQGTAPLSCRPKGRFFLVCVASFFLKVNHCPNGCRPPHSRGLEGTMSNALFDGSTMGWAVCSTFGCSSTA